MGELPKSLVVKLNQMCNEDVLNIQKTITIQEAVGRIGDISIFISKKVREKVGDIVKYRNMVASVGLAENGTSPRGLEAKTKLDLSVSEKRL